MGLDMYLTAKWRKYQSDKDGKIVKIKRVFPEIFSSGNIEYVGVEFEAGYWRKANHIHNWFVNKIQKGKDDCGSYDVTREELQELKLLCIQVITQSKLKKSKVASGFSFDANGNKVPILADGEIVSNPKVAGRLLPTKEGFFFGHAQYDEYYIMQCRDTVEIISRCLEIPKEWDFSYQASW